MEWFSGFKDHAQIVLKARTEGDGMESADDQEIKNIKKESDTNENVMIDTPIPNFQDTILTTRFPHNVNLGTLVNLTPTEIHYLNRKPKSISKEPKFVPYEPYKAATRPIASLEKGKPALKKKSSKNNMDLSVLVSQIALVDTNPIPFESSKRPIKDFDVEQIHIDESDVLNKHLQNEITQLKAENFSLKDDNETLKDQIKQQAQVNKELKTMLVASMGEDLKTTFQTLTEDKQQLASALINSAKHLSTHQEQTEWLAGQCEVWRSKFLASSLMVEELAEWKNVFTQRTEDLQIALKQILEERNRIRDILIHTYRNMQSLHENWLTNLASLNELVGFEQTPIGSINLACSKLKSSNVLDLATVNLKFSENLCNGIKKIDDISHVLNRLSMNTDGEDLAEKLLATPLHVSKKNDHPSMALVNLAYAKTGMVPNIACCAHCNGQIQLL